MLKIPDLDTKNVIFPPITDALSNPNGLLACGGNLEVATIINAYRQGIFPWFSEGEPILWWSPDPRMILYPDELHISKSLNKLLKKHKYEVTVNQHFTETIDSCAKIRHNQGTWITTEMIMAYTKLHQAGYAHSVEVLSSENLVGGLYGIAIGKIFFGESMFSFEPNTSKIALVKLVEILQKNDFRIIDCQQQTQHLASMGARLITRDLFLSLLKHNSKVQQDFCFVC